MREENSFRAGLRDGIPICLGYLSVSFAFGIFAVGSGLSIFEALLISMTNVTSAGQLAAVPIITGGGTLIELAASTFVINMRYALMSLSLSQKLDSRYGMFHRITTSFGITDEVFAVASGREGTVSSTYMYGLITLPYIFWAAGTAGGALLGGILPDFLKSALGIAIYGMFIAIVIPPAKKSVGVTVTVLAAAGLSCALYYIPCFGGISSGLSVIICTVIAAAAGALFFPRKQEVSADE